MVGKLRMKYCTFKLSPPNPSPSAPHSFLPTGQQSNFYVAESSVKKKKGGAMPSFTPVAQSTATNEACLRSHVCCMCVHLWKFLHMLAFVLSHGHFKLKPRASLGLLNPDLHTTTVWKPTQCELHRIVTLWKHTARCNKGNLSLQIIRVLPDRHPSRSYTAELERRFRDVEGVFVQSHPAEVSWSSHISTAAEINSLPNNLIHLVNEFSYKSNRARRMSHWFY